MAAVARLRRRPEFLAVAASRKVGIAVRRNRARRRLKAAAEAVLPKAGQPGFDYVVVARNETVTRAFADLVADLETALARVHQSRQKPGAA